MRISTQLEQMVLLPIPFGSYGGIGFSWDKPWLELAKTDPIYLDEKSRFPGLCRE